MAGCAGISASTSLSTFGPPLLSLDYAQDAQGSTPTASYTTVLYFHTPGTGRRILMHDQLIPPSNRECVVTNTPGYAGQDRGRH